ncbi:Light-harvesting protein B-800/850 beta 1 chain B4 [Magnetospirillum molischianum DSM 120]|uniref:Light-harvesting protein B-800/850 beta 1 chain B4 n=1 Tax=Magnetospirillum molischianum DSM 120 TaxID=1150626 RepID=H8FN96_MAGML|nr:Light-harvesting protein B-800/850 beta 1 chain B4 [Magnetospirillum molischianum DSM 120]
MRDKEEKVSSRKIDLTPATVNATLHSVNEARQRRTPLVAPTVMELHTWLREACRV